MCLILERMPKKKKREERKRKEKIVKGCEKKKIQRIGKWVEGEKWSVKSVLGLEKWSQFNSTWDIFIFESLFSQIFLTYQRAYITTKDKDISDFWCLITSSRGGIRLWESLW